MNESDARLLDRKSRESSHDNYWSRNRQMAFARSIGARRCSPRREKSFTLLLRGHEETTETADREEDGRA